jgi:hypothetical protein
MLPRQLKQCFKVNLTEKSYCSSWFCLGNVFDSKDIDLLIAMNSLIFLNFLDWQCSSQTALEIILLNKKTFAIFNTFFYSWLIKEREKKRTVG